MAKRTTRTKKRAQLPLTEQPRSFMDYVSGTSRLSREPVPAKPGALATIKTGLANLKSLAGQLPTANPFAFDKVVADEAKGVSTKNRTMKKRSKRAEKNTRGEAAKDKELNMGEGGVKDINFDEKSRAKKRGEPKESKSELAKDKKKGIKEGSAEDEAMDAKGMRKHRGSINKSGSFKGKSNKLGFGGRAAQMKAKGVPGGVIGAIARKEGAAPGGPNYHSGKKRQMPQRRTNKSMTGMQLLHKATDRRR